MESNHGRQQNQKLRLSLQRAKAVAGFLALQAEPIPMERRNLKEFEERKNGLNALSIGNQNEFLSPIYFGVACGIAAFTMLEAGRKNRTARWISPLSGSFNAVQTILKGSSQLLGLLLWKAQRVVVEANNREEWELERKAMAEKIAKAEAEVAEMKKQRAEDAKANEKVVAIFATQEHCWRNERRNLKQQLETVLQEFHGFLNDKQMQCPECQMKDKNIAELEGRISEKEFLMMVAMEAADAERQQKNDLQNKLAVSEALSAELKQKILKEEEEREAEFRKRKAVFVDFVSNHREMKIEMNKALRELELVKKENALILSEKTEAENIIQSSSVQIALLEQDSKDQMALISDLLQKYYAKVTEKDEVEEELNISEGLRRRSELEAHKWKMENEGKKKKRKNKKGCWKLRKYANSGLDLFAEPKIFHMKYGTEILVPQDEIKRYDEKLTELENNIMIHVNQTCKKRPLRDFTSRRSNTHLELTENIKHLRVQDICRMDSNISEVFNLLNSNKVSGSEKSAIDDAQQRDKYADMLEHSRDWIQTENATHRAKVDQKHWNASSFQDEKEEDFHCSLSKVAKDSKKLRSRTDSANQHVKQTKQQDKVLESLLTERNQDLQLLKRRLKFLEDKNSQKQPQDLQKDRKKMDSEAITSKLKAVRRKLRDHKQGREDTIMKILEADNKLQENHYKLAMFKAKSLQTESQNQRVNKGDHYVFSNIMQCETRFLDRSFGLEDLTSTRKVSEKNEELDLKCRGYK